MSDKTKYTLLFIAILAFVSVMIIEIFDRWQLTFRQYENYKELEKNALNPEELAQKHAGLITQKKVLYLQFSRKICFYFIAFCITAILQNIGCIR